MDLAFIIDGSGSICDSDPSRVVIDGQVHCDNWDTIVEFLTKFVEELEVGPNNVRVAMVVFGEDASLYWDFTE